MDESKPPAEQKATQILDYASPTLQQIDWKFWASLPLAIVMLVLCWPLGLGATIYAIYAFSAWRRNELDDARELMSTSSKLSHAAFWTGLLVCLAMLFLSMQ